MTKVRKLIPPLCNELWFFFFLAGIFSLPSWMVLKNVSYITLFLIPILLSFLIRKTVKNFFLFLGLNLLFVLPVFALDLYQSLFYGAFFLFLFFNTFIKRLKPYQELSFSAIVVVLGLNIAVSVSASVLGYKQIPPYMFIYSLLAVLTFLISSQIRKVDYSLELITATTFQPVDRILSFNNRTFLLFAGILLVLSVGSLLIDFEGYIYGLLGLILTGIRYLASLQKPELPGEPLVEVTPPPPPPATMGRFPLDPGKENFIVKLIEEIIMFLMQIVLVLGFIGLILYAAYLLYKKFYSVKKSDDIVEFISPETSLERMLQSIKTSFLGPSNKLRRIYFKKVKSYIKKGSSIQSSDTTAEIQEKLSSFEDISELTGKYEQVRYGKE